MDHNPADLARTPVEPVSVVENPFQVSRPSDDLLLALGRAWWAGLVLGGQMVTIGVRLGVPARRAWTASLGALRRDLATALQSAQGIPPGQLDALRSWATRLDGLIELRNDLAHATPFSGRRVGPRMG